MATGETQTTMAYHAIAANLLVLRDGAREGNNGDIKAINSILASVMSLQLIDRFSRIPVASTRKASQPVLAGATDRVLKEAPTFLTDNPWRVPRLAELAPN